MNALIKKLESGSLTDSETAILVDILKEQKRCIEYYSQNFVSTWDNSDININWRAVKSNDHRQEKIDDAK